MSWWRIGNKTYRSLSSRKIGSSLSWGDDVRGERWRPLKDSGVSTEVVSVLWAVVVGRVGVVCLVCSVWLGVVLVVLDGGTVVVVVVRGVDA